MDIIETNKFVMQLISDPLIFRNDICMTVSIRPSYFAAHCGSFPRHSAVGRDTKLCKNDKDYHLRYL
jgi:hypothetical protein